MSTKKRASTTPSTKKAVPDIDDEIDPVETAASSGSGPKLKTVRIRMAVEERAKLFQLANERGLKASQWVRLQVVDTWKKREDKARREAAA